MKPCVRKSYVDYFVVEGQELPLQEGHVGLFGCWDIEGELGVDSVLESLQLERLLHEADEFCELFASCLSLVIKPPFPLAVARVEISLQ